MNLGAVALGPEAAQCLVRHAWPGNVRELDNAIQRALILQQGGLIQPADLCLTAPIGMPLAAPVPMPAMPPATPPSVEIPSPAAGQDASGALGDDLRRREFQVIIDTLRTERGRRKEAAERLASARGPCATSSPRCATPGWTWRPISTPSEGSPCSPGPPRAGLCVRRRSSPGAVRACAPADNRSRDGPCCGRGHWRRTPMPGLGGDLAPLLLTPLQSAGRRQKAAAVGGRVMSQGVEFNRLMLEMRSMQMEAMARPRPNRLRRRPKQGRRAFRKCSPRPWTR